MKKIIIIAMFTMFAFTVHAQISDTAFVGKWEVTHYGAYGPFRNHFNLHRNHIYQFVDYQHVGKEGKWSVKNDMLYFDSTATYYINDNGLSEYKKGDTLIGHNNWQQPSKITKMSSIPESIIPTKFEITFSKKESRKTGYYLIKTTLDSLHLYDTKNNEFLFKGKNHETHLYYEFFKMNIFLNTTTIVPKFNKDSMTLFTFKSKGFPTRYSTINTELLRIYLTEMKPKKAITFDEKWTWVHENLKTQFREIYIDEIKIGKGWYRFNPYLEV